MYKDMVYLGIGRKTSIGNIETTDIRPPWHIGKDGVSLYLNNSSSCVPPLYVPKAIGTALLVVRLIIVLYDGVTRYDNESFFSVGSK